MELKLPFVVFSFSDGLLLIVPYGIETMKELINQFDLFELLIVPYGIETISPSYNIVTVPAFNRTLWN